MRVWVDREVCDNHGQCVFAEPGVFALDDDGILSYSEDVPDGLRDRVEQASLVCPTSAIRIVD